MKNALIYIISKISLHIGNIVYNFAISFYLLSETETAKSLSINLTLSIVASLITTPLSGIITDRYNRKNIIIITETLHTLLLLFLILITYYFTLSLLIIFTTTFLKTIISNIADNTFNASITQLFNENELIKISSISGILQSIAVIISPFIAGLLYGINQILIIFILFFLLSLLSTIINIFLNFSENNLRHNKRTNKISLNSYDEIIRYVYNNKLILILILSLPITNFLYTSVSLFPEKVLIVDLKFNSYYIGLLSGFIGFSTLCSSIYLMKLKKLPNIIRVSKYVFTLVGILFFLMTISYAFIDTKFTIYIIFLICSLFITSLIQFNSIPITIYFQKIIPNHMKGRFFSIINLCTICISPISMLTYSILYDMKLYVITNCITSFLFIFISLILFKKKYTNLVN